MNLLEDFYSKCPLRIVVGYPLMVSKDDALAYTTSKLRETLEGLKSGYLQSPNDWGDGYNVRTEEVNMTIDRLLAELK